MGKGRAARAVHLARSDEHDGRDGGLGALQACSWLEFRWRPLAPDKVHRKSVVWPPY